MADGRIQVKFDIDTSALDAALAKAERLSRLSDESSDIVIPVAATLVAASATVPVSRRRLLFGWWKR